MSYGKCGQAQDAQTNAEPMDEQLNSQFERRPVGGGVVQPQIQP